MLGLVAAQFNVKLWAHLKGFPAFVIMSSYLHMYTQLSSFEHCVMFSSLKSLTLTAIHTITLNLART